MSKELAKTYDHKEVEPRIYKMWEELGVFSPEGAQKLQKDAKDETFCVLMPPPNANAPLHCGHATYSIQDVMARFMRMRGYKTLYLPGTDHAGFETQVVYEKNLKKEGKSRFDFGREELFKAILDFVNKNSEIAIDQLKRIGMSADWDRNVFMLDDKVVDLVLNTFEKMHKDGLIYKDMYLVNYSPHHGTTFSNLETTHKETVSPLYYVKYQVKGTKDSITVATVRPETIFADVAVAVNPKDSRYKDFVGKYVINPLNDREMTVIEDPFVDMEFGTGALKITPGHDFNDFEIGKKHNLEMISVVDIEGKMVNAAEEVNGLRVKKAREKTVELLGDAIEKVDEKYTHNLLVDYKDEKPIEPLLFPNWFVKMEGLADKAIKAIEGEKVKYNSSLWKKESLRWLSEIRDWPISRQIVFGIRMPVWYSVKENPDLVAVFLDEEGKRQEARISDLGDIPLDVVRKNLQQLKVPNVDAKYVISKDSPGEDFLQETDTFDTWFSSGQWPQTTLGYPDGGDYKTFFPTTFMDSMWDILFFWIARMIMFSLYLTDEVPFKNVYIHGRIDDEHGQKMSKSKGNVIDPLEYVEKYGADALRMGILVGGNTAARSTSLSEDKARGYRNFSNKIWNMARFMNMMFEEHGKDVAWIEEVKDGFSGMDKEILNGLNNLVKNTTEGLEGYRFKEVGDSIYHFMWDELADKYIEEVKGREDKEVALSVLRHAFIICLKLLHPFMPFVTEEVWNYIPGIYEKPLATSGWPV